MIIVLKSGHSELGCNEPYHSDRILSWAEQTRPDLRMKNRIRDL